MRFLRPSFRLLVALVATLALSACGDSVDGPPVTTTSFTEIPSAVLTLPSGGQLRAYIAIDGGARTEMPIVGTTASTTITNLTRAVHTVLIEYEFTDSVGRTFTVASATRSVDLSSGNASISFAETDYDLNSHDDDGDGVSNAAELALGTDPAAGNISGVWSVSEQFFSTDISCTFSSVYDVNITQDFNTVTVTETVSGDQLTGTLSGDALSLTGSITQGGIGILTYSSITGTVAADCSSLNADTVWSYSEPGFSCSGTSTINANRVSGGTTCTDSPTGVWEGTITISGFGSFDAVAIIQGDQVRVISELQQVGYAGNIAVSGTSFTASMTEYALGGPQTGFTTSLVGTFLPETSLSGTFTSNDGSSGTFSFGYDPVTSKGSSLATTAATWFGQNTALQFTIDSAGVLSGTDGLCVYTGNLSILDSAVNIYGLSLTISSCPGFDGTYGGYAVVTDVFSVNDALNIVVHNNNLLIADELLR